MYSYWNANVKSGLKKMNQPQVLVHSPYDFPETVGKGFAVAKGQEAFIAVDAQRTEA